MAEPTPQIKPKLSTLGVDMAEKYLREQNDPTLEDIEMFIAALESQMDEGAIDMTASVTFFAGSLTFVALLTAFEGQPIWIQIPMLVLVLGNLVIGGLLMMRSRRRARERLHTLWKLYRARRDIHVRRKKLSWWKRLLAG